MAKLRGAKKMPAAQIVGLSVQKYLRREERTARSSIQARKMSSKLKFAVGFSAVALSIAVAAVAQNAVLKGTVLKELEVRPNASLIDKYGDAANDPAVADALRKAQGQQITDQLKETSNTYEALQNGTLKPGADPTTALMYGYVPPNMSPEQAQILYKHLPHLPKMPRPMSAEGMAGEREVQMPMAAEPMAPYIPYPESFHTREPKTRQLQTIPQQMLPGQMAGMPGMPMMGFGSGMGYGLDREEIAAQNQKIAEESIRARFGPVAVPTLQPGHNWLADQARKNAASQHAAESDHQSTVGVCDASGNEITSIQYDPWGNHTVLSGGTVMPDRMYKGMFYLPRADLYMTPNRVYSAKLGRWLSRDPLGEAAGTNLYAYCDNDPINKFDPFGLDVLVIENGPIATNPFGHTAIGVTGAGVYSFGNNTPLGTSASSYLLGQAGRRDSQIFVLKTTPAQDAAALAYLRGFPNSKLPPHSATRDNCSSRTQTALDRAGIPTFNQDALDRILPGHAGIRAAGAGATEFDVPQGAILPNPVQQAIQQFEPR